MVIVRAEWLLFGQNGSLNDIDSLLTHWGRVTHICVGNLTIIGSDNGLSPGRRQAITCTNAGILLIGWTLGNKLLWNLNQNLHIFIHENVCESAICKMASIWPLPLCIKDKMQNLPCNCPMTGIHISEIFYLSNLLIYAFFNLLVQNIEKKWAQIHLPKW